MTGVYCIHTKNAGTDAEWTERFYFTQVGDYNEAAVTHWMPLPPPPATPKESA